MKSTPTMTTPVLPTFRRSAFRRLPRSLQAPWGPGMPGTHFVLRGDEYDVDIQDASPLTTGRAALVKRRRRRRKKQRGGAPPPPRWQVAQRAYVNRLPQCLDRSVNRGLWKIRNKLTPTTLTGKLAGAAALGGAAAAAPLALLGTLVGQLLRKQKV